MNDYSVINKNYFVETATYNKMQISLSEQVFVMQR